MFECQDESDENYCEPLSIDKRSYRKIFPPVSKFKTNIFVTMNIHSITNIDEMSMTFTAEVAIELQWKDSRITFKDLKSEGNFLDKVSQDQIWLPPLTFSNTDGNSPLLGENSIKVEVLRQGSAKLNNLYQLNEGTYFKGDENDLLLYVDHECNFHCTGGPCITRI